MGPATPAGGKQLIAQGIVDHGVFDAVKVAHGNGYGHLGHAMDEVGGAVQGIDDPFEILALDGAAFFGDDAVLRIGAADDLDDGRLGAAVHLGDIVVVGLAGDSEFGDPVDGAVNQVAGLAGGTNGGDEDGMLHGNLWANA